MFKRLIEITGGILMSILVFLPMAANASVLSIFAEQSEIYKDKTTRLEVGIDTEGKKINALEARLIIPRGLDVVALETGDSIISLWVSKPEYDQNTRIVTLAGGIPGGFAGRGLVASIIVRGEETGNYNVIFDSPVFVLLHDGLGTPDETIVEGEELVVLGQAPLEVSSSTHPEDSWVALSEAEITWTETPEALYSWEVNTIPEFVPDTEAEVGKPPIKIQGLGSGMHYFHIREGLKDGEKIIWGNPVHVRMLVDLDAPKPYEVSLNEGEAILVAEDESSGVKFIEYRAKSNLFGKGEFKVGDDSGWRKQESFEKINLPWLTRLFGGTVFVRVFDGAGNMREQSIGYAGSSSPIVAWVVVLAFAILILAGILKRIKRDNKNKI